MLKRLWRWIFPKYGIQFRKSWEETKSEEFLQTYMQVDDRKWRAHDPMVKVRKWEC